MPVYSYEAVEPNGRVIKGSLDAENASIVLAKLQTLNYTVVDVTESRGGAKAASAGRPGGRVKLNSLVVFSRQFATMVNAGINILKCLDILEAQTKDPALRPVIIEVRKDVVGGASLTDALAKHPNCFSKLFVSMVKAAEAGGILDLILDRLATFLEKEQEIIGRIKGAMVYPVCVLVFAILMVIAMFIFVLPTFKDIFAGSGAELPLITRMLFFISDTIRAFWYLLPTIPMGLYFGTKQYNKTEQGRWNLDKIKLRIPVIGELVQKMAISRFSRTLGTLVNSGVPVLRALEIVAETAGNVVIARAVDQARASVREGQRISAPLAASGMFPQMVTQMMDIGEETGRMSEMLIKIATFYDNEVDVAVKALTSLIEPLLIIFLGGIVGFIVGSIMVPMFTLINVISK
ncbi:MAG: type secretion system family protein [Armatimonadetes bacterium]|jgi:type IV pilus assembly protein PilC|nr:type secretion system family protein [Armatimonadota bacterium]